MNFLRGSVRQYELFADAIKNNDKDFFSEYYKQRLKAVGTKGVVKLELLSRLCVLYRKASFLQVIYEIEKEPLNTSGGLGFNLKLLDLARAIGANDCVEVILNSCPKEQPQCEIDQMAYKLYTECIKMASNYPKFPEINASAICALAEHGYDINETGPGGKTPLHEAVLNKADSIIIDALIEHGADVDKVDAFGTSAFRNQLQKNRYYSRQELVKIVQIFLKGNPALNFYVDVIPSVLISDDNYCTKVVTGKEAEMLYKTDEDDDSYRKRVERNLLTPLLLRHGFKLDQALSDTYYHPDLTLVLQHILCNPLPLSHLCRNVLRHTFPGRYLVAMCNAVLIPKSTTAFILSRDKYS